MKIKLILLAACLLLASALAGCSSHEALSAGQFVSLMEESGYGVEALEVESGSPMLSWHLAGNDLLHIEFTQLHSDSAAAGVFQSMREDLEAGAGSGSATTSISAGSYASFTLSAGDMYYSLQRVGDTVLYCEAPKDSKGEIQAAVKALGY